MCSVACAFWCVRTLLIDAPGGGGKVPINPEYIERITDDEVVFRNYEGQRFGYPLKSTPVPDQTPAVVVATEKVQAERSAATGQP